LSYNSLKMQIEFYKYQGTGNDFIMIDNRSDFFPKNDCKLVEKLCDRRFGIGADGLILLENDSASDFRMVYYNSDGNESSMCGNGGRCLVAFARQLGVIENETSFIATDGPHYATIGADDIVSLQMINVDKVQKEDSYTFLNTGSPHHIEIVDDLANYHVREKGAAIRYGALYGEKGSNVNFVKKVSDSEFSLRTYERGVEDETLACGTGATAAAIAMYATGATDKTAITINVEGGRLAVSFDKEGDHFTNVFLKGPAKFVFKGTIEI
jgi:diaminopimelate epimerase